MPGFAPIRQDEYPATDETQCIAVYIPAGDEYKALLAGFIAMLSDVYSYEDPTSAQADGIAATFDEGYSLCNWDGCGVPPECLSMNTNFVLFPATATVKTGNALALVIDATARLNSYWQQNPSASTDKFSWDVWLDRGEYAFRWTYMRTTGSAIINLQISDQSGIIENTNHDMYGTTLANQIFTGSFTAPEGGETEIGMLVNGRNASNTTAYLNRTVLLEIWKVADL